MIVLRKKPVLPTDAVEVPLTRNMVAYVSPDKLQLLNQYYWRAVKSSSGYYARARYQINGKTHTIRMHRLLTGALPGQIAHHKNHNRLDNTDENLEVHTARQHRHYDGWHYFEL